MTDLVAAPAAYRLMIAEGEAAPQAIRGRFQVRKRLGGHVYPHEIVFVDEL